MYKIVVTEGLVLERRALGEADLLMSLLTREYGLVRARALGARLQKSKLRYGLQTLSQGAYSLVRGRNGWRVVGADHVSRAFITAPHQAVIGRVIKLVLRLVHGEESGELYQTIVDGFGILVKLPSEKVLGSASQSPQPDYFLQEVSPDAIEVVLVLRILSQLGYLPHTPALEPFVSGDFTLETAAKALQSRSLLIKTINESLHQTGL